MVNYSNEIQCFNYGLVIFWIKIISLTGDKALLSQSGGMLHKLDSSRGFLLAQSLSSKLNVLRDMHYMLQVMVISINNNHIVVKVARSSLGGD